MFFSQFSRQALMIPGLLIIDTPGHESFSNLRTRGSSLCDIAILVVDIMHGLEPQTIESINILKRGRVPFIIALNKVDRLLDWKRSPTLGIRDNLKKQKVVASSQFEELYQQVIVQFAEQELNVSLFWNKVNFKEYIPVCPTSAMSGDGMGDLMALLTTVCQKHLLQQLQFSEDLECHVLEVKAISGLGMTIDVILRNGFLKEGDTIVLCGVDGPFTTQIRALLTPQPLRELRVKNTYIQHKLLAGAQGIKLTGKELEKALAGTPLFVASSPEDVEPLKDKAQSTLSATLNAVKCQDIGVYVQASTLGSLEALVEFLKHSKIPYSGVNIGPVHKKDVMKASVMLEHKNDYAVILAFDVKIEREAQEMADSLGVRIFSADIIYHLFDSFMKYREELRQRLREQYKDIAIFPCKLKILPNCVFKTRDPIVVGVKVEGGLVKVGTPLTVPSKNFCDIGIVSSMEANHKPVDVVKKGAEVCLKIDPIPGEAPRLLGRHFDEADLIVSKISRQSIDAVKDYFREDLQKGDWQLMVELKKQFQIL
jgi:translation initiation factor 5B